MQKPRCVIIGGSGFIGQHVAERLLKHDYTVVICTRGTTFLLPELTPFVRNIDITQTHEIEELFEKGDIVFDFASPTVPHSSMSHPEREIDLHIKPHVLMIQSAMKKQIKKYIFTSSGGGVYGKNPQTPITELVAPQPITPYAIAKITIEHYLSFFSNLYQIPHLIYRISNPYGPRQQFKEGFGVIPTLINHIETNTPPELYNEGNAVRDFIYIDDVVDAIEVSFTADNTYSVYNIGSGNGTSINEIWKTLKSITKSELEPIFKESRSIDADKIILDISRFQEEYSWKPQIDVREGLQKLLQKSLA